MAQHRGDVYSYLAVPSADASYPLTCGTEGRDRCAVGRREAHRLGLLQDARPLTIATGLAEVDTQRGARLDLRQARG